MENNGIKELGKMLNVITKYHGQIKNTFENGGEIRIKQNKNKDFVIYQDFINKIK